MTELSPLRQTIRRDEIVSWMRGLISRIEALPLQTLQKHTVAPAGISLELFFDDADHASAYLARLPEAKATEKARYKIYVLSGKVAAEVGVSTWSDMQCSPHRLQRVLAEAGFRALYPYRQGVWQFVSTAGTGVQLSTDREALPEWDEGAPLRPHMHWILQLEGMRLTHAATLGSEGKGVLLLGPGGAGKSATTLSGLWAGLSTVGDDYVALSMGERIQARSLFRIVKQDRRGLARFPRLNESTSGYKENWRGKVQFDPEKVFPGSFVNKLDIRAVLMPRIAHSPTPTIVRSGPGEALRALINSNVFQFPGEPDDGMHYFGSLLRRLPCYRMELSEAAENNGGLLADFVGQL